MEDIFVPPDNKLNKPRGRGGTGSVSPLADPPPEISVTSDEAIPPGNPFSAIENNSGESNPEMSNSGRFPSGFSPFQALPYDPDPFPPFFMFASSELTPASVHDEDDSMDEGNPVQEPKTPVSDGGPEDVVSEIGEESQEIDDWSLASSGDQWHLVTDHCRDSHSTPSDFVLASEGTPSIPDDLKSFSTDQDEESSDEDKVSSDHDEAPTDHDEMSFYDYPDDVMSGFGAQERGNAAAIKSKNLSFGHLNREDTLEDDTDCSDHRMYYDLNDNEECTMPLGDPLLSSIVFDIKEDRTVTEDIFHDTEDGEEDMETPRAPSLDHINNVTSLHSWCSASNDDPDMAAKAGGSGGLYFLNVPQENFPETPTLHESLQEESFFDSGNFQRVDDAYECYPAKRQTRKKNRLIGYGPHPKSWLFCSHKKPKRGKAKRKSKDRRKWKLDDHHADV